MAITRNRLLVIGATAVAFILFWLCSLAALSVLGGKAPLATLPSPATMTGCVVIRPPASSSHAPVVVLDACGTRIERTPTFITADEWAVEYRFDCTAVGGPSIFQANAYEAAGVQVGTLQVTLANESARKSGGTVPVHATPGAHYISISTACTWTLTVTSMDTHQ